VSDFFGWGVDGVVVAVVFALTLRLTLALLLKDFFFFLLRAIS
jgi:hypothetical protein